MADDRQGNQDGKAPKGGGNRLPPPAFPPGQRVQARTNHRSAAGGTGAEGAVPDDAFISPDEPIVRTGSRFAADAFISPDAPLPRRGSEDPDEGVVTGIGNDAHMGHDDVVMGARLGDPAVADLAARVGRLADALKSKGEAALKTSADMSKFETTLRAYCVGYLAAQRDAG